MKFPMVKPGDDWWVHSLRIYSAMIASGVHFAEACYGDGEWKCILGYPGGTQRGTEQLYEKWLGRALADTLINPAGQWCIYLHAPRNPKLEREAAQWVRDHDIDVIWFSSRCLTAAFGRGEADVFFKACRGRRVILVGPEHLKRLPQEVLGHAHHVQVTLTRAYEEVDATCKAVLSLAEPGDIVLFASGFASNLAIHRLCPDLLGKVTLWDVGAIFDPLCGVYSRRGYKKRTWQENVMPRNLE